MDRLFLDANVLFSAAYSADSGLYRLWELPETELLTSPYAIDEAHRNLDTPEQRTRLEALTKRLYLVRDATDLPATYSLREKDRPILAAAIQAGASHLITGDLRDFGPYMGFRLGGVLIEMPRTYLSRRDPR